jgi:hypothetical protein
MKQPVHIQQLTSHLTLLTTSLEVHPSGLSTAMSPFGSGGGASAGAEVVDISATALHCKALKDALTTDGAKQFADLLIIRPSMHSLMGAPMVFSILNKSVKLFNG